MSWSMSKSGTPAEVAASIRDDTATHYALASPAEEAARASAVAAVLSAIALNQNGTSVTVSASGYESASYGDGGVVVKRVQNINITVSSG